MVRSIVKASCFQPLLSVPQAIWGTLSSMVTSWTFMVPTLHQTKILWKARWWVMSTRASQGDRNMGVEKRPLGWAPCWPSPYRGSLSLLFRAILKLDQIHPFDSLELSVKQTLSTAELLDLRFFNLCLSELIQSLHKFWNNYLALYLDEKQHDLVSFTSNSEPVSNAASQRGCLIFLGLQSLCRNCSY